MVVSNRVTTLDNPVAVMNLQFRQGEPLSWITTVKGANWAGTYDAAIIDADGNEVAMAVSGIFSTPDTEVTIVLTQANSQLLKPGQYKWAARLPSGEIYFRGEVLVEREPVGLE